MKKRIQVVLLISLLILCGALGLEGLVAAGHSDQPVLVAHGGAPVPIPWHGGAPVPIPWHGGAPVPIPW